METDRELTQLRARVAHLESLVERLTGSSPQVVPQRVSAADDAASPGVDRRRMLRNGLGLSAAAVAGIGMLDAVGSPAAADDGDAIQVAQTASPTAATSDPTRIVNPSSQVHSTVLFQVDNTTDSSISLPADTSAAIVATIAGHDDDPTDQAAVLGLAEFGTGVDGRSEGYVGVSGTSTFAVGVSGTSTDGTGVQATSDSGPALTATSTSGRGIVATSDSGEAIHATSTSNVAITGKGAFGIVGNGTGSSGGVGVGASGGTGVLTHGDGIGLDATSQNGVAVKATSTSGTGVQATSGSGSAMSGTSTSASGVSGVSTTGTGVRARSSSGTALDARSDSAAGVSAASGGAAAAVAAANTGTGPAIRATAGTGVGASFSGRTAPIRLVPHSTVGHPKSGRHQRGEIVLDHAGALWVCTKPGTPGRWKKVAFA